MDSTRSREKESLKKSLIQNMPNKRGELIFIYHMLGEILFKKNWDDSSIWLYDKSEMIQYNKLVGMIEVCKIFCKFDNEFNYYINFIFQEALKRLSNL